MPIVEHMQLHKCEVILQQSFLKAIEFLNVILFCSSILHVTEMHRIVYRCYVSNVNDVKRHQTKNCIAVQRKITIYVEN